MLTSRSAHPSAVRAWPIAHLRSTLRLYSPDRVIETADGYIDRFKNLFAPPGLVHILQRVRHEALQGTVSKARVAKDQRQWNWWMVVPFHPAFDRCGLSRLVRDFVGEPCFRAAFFAAWGREAPELNVSWSSGKCNLATSVARNSVHRNWDGGWV